MQPTHWAKATFGLAFLACSSPTSPIHNGSQFVLTQVNGMLVEESVCKDVITSRLTIHTSASGTKGKVTALNRLTVNESVVVQSDTLQFAASTARIHFATLGSSEFVATAEIQGNGDQMLVRHRGCYLHDPKGVRDIWFDLLYISAD